MRHPLTIPLSLLLACPCLAAEPVDEARETPGGTRLLLAPTGRPLAPGTGYISDHYVFLPAVAYGVTDQVSVLAGVSWLPALGWSEQLKYVTPRLAFRPSDGDAEYHSPIIGYGGSWRLSPRLTLISENWLITTPGFRLAEQPFGIGVRTMSDVLSADAGFVLIGEALKEGFPIPWLSMTYYFGHETP